MNKNIDKGKIVSDDVTQAFAHTTSEGQFDFKNPPEIDEPLYALAMESTQVVADLLSWPDYDNTEIGRELLSYCCYSLVLFCAVVQCGDALMRLPTPRFCHSLQLLQLLLTAQIYTYAHLLNHTYAHYSRINRSMLP